ncbi:yae1 domain-containing protein 1 [Plakobranchus ocellatus]|uniref:Yae1 domain-containing protein 1 n=1 Tax=Plakobranchus ocellatus TaxID=259542 RepID=A0AAV4C487_9GAST|nr:yae1 domain-containing protein 1 [Plakobranchus ocellatus]
MGELSSESRHLSKTRVKKTTQRRQNPGDRAVFCCRCSTTQNVMRLGILPQCAKGRWQNCSCCLLAQNLANSTIMSQAVPKKIDDPFGSDDEDLVLMHKEWLKVDDGLRNAGYRNGMEASQEQFLQGSFNNAFRNSLQMAMSAGKLQGAISALLSCPFEGPVQNSRSQQLQQESQLQQILTRNENLMAGIPQILVSEKLKSADLNINKSEMNGVAQDLVNSPPSPSHMPVSNCTSLTDASYKDRKGGENQTENKNYSCEDVCSNRTHFWSQLESFRMQAEALGVSTSND